MDIFGLAASAAQLAQLAAQISVSIVFACANISSLALEEGRVMNEVSQLISTAKYIEEHRASLLSPEVCFQLEKAIAYARALKELLENLKPANLHIISRWWKILTGLEKNEVQFQLDKLLSAKAYLVLIVQLEYSDKLSSIQGGLHQLLLQNQESTTSRFEMGPRKSTITLEAETSTKKGPTWPASKAGEGSKALVPFVEYSNRRTAQSATKASSSMGETKQQGYQNYSTNDNQITNSSSYEASHRFRSDAKFSREVNGNKIDNGSRFFDVVDATS